MSKKLVIRINNLQDNENDDTYEVNEETIIRWDRVVAVSVLALALMAVVIWGGWQLFSKTSSTKVDTDSFTDSGAVINSDLDSQALVLEAAPENEQETIDASGKAVEGNTVAASSKGAESVESSESSESVRSTKSEAAHNTALEDISKAAESKKSDVTPVGAGTAQIKRKTSAEKAVLVDQGSRLAKPEQGAAINSPDPVTIESSRIVKAQLTHRVKNSEPVDKLGSVIPMNEDKLIRVYLFTGMEGLKGETLYHDWYLSGKKMARVKIKVKNDKTSASSSKFIDRHMTGDWRVKVTTSRGDELVSASFNVVN
ncbi:DUF2914 domain-containing protein [Alkalimarinus coralli]|uniref:DUF2914 domain-containing protein n=1 Tax=Alkalimarinus coralli TaxID=2935863 RepID=UPI00202B81F7|nr:DUF2914 domain-containing protein [Alkalimarinus coralli]